MKKIISICLLSIFLTGCNLLPKINFDTSGSVPQSIEKSKIKEQCKKGAKWDENGNLISCENGYKKYEENYEKKERKMTITEKVKSFINNLVGWGFWGIVLLLVLCPSLLGLIIGRITEGAVGVTGKTLRAVVRGVQNARKNGTDLNVALATELDKQDKKVVAKIKEQEKIK